MAVGRKQKETTTRLWIGGTSGLARTYMNAFVIGNDADDDIGGDHWILLGHTETPPEWIPPSAHYYAYDLTTDKPPGSTVLLDKLATVKQIVIGIRPPLFSRRTNVEMSSYCHKLVRGLETFLKTLLMHNSNVQSILHISSVAAANHLEAQHDERSILLCDDGGESTTLQAPYDVFKRDCEQVVERLSPMLTATSTTTSLRLGAIFSDTTDCIQCQALGIQSRMGSYVAQTIDCNSSRNVSSAIRLVLSRQLIRQEEQQRQQQPPLARYYYYTRPICQYPQPVPYGEYLVQYRRALDLKFYIWIPARLVRCLIEMVHWLAVRSTSRVAFIDSIDYLLQVSYRDHSFDNTAFATDFDIIPHEETIEECFRRRQTLLYSS